MQPLRRILVSLAIGCAVYYGWKLLSPAARETVLLHTAAVRNQDHYATIWVVDDGPYLWIRAENRSRRWLDPVLSKPRLELRRAGATLRYDARAFDTPEAAARVDALFRAKYGLSDRFRELAENRDPLPIRLERR